MPQRHIIDPMTFIKISLDFSLRLIHMGYDYIDVCIVYINVESIFLSSLSSISVCIYSAFPIIRSTVNCMSFHAFVISVCFI